MAGTEKVRLLVNLPPGFFRCAQLRDTFRRLGKLATIRKRSHNKTEEIAADLA